MVVADEETMPALPTRASSREFGTGIGSGVKVFMAMLGGVALAGAGAAVAFKMGILTTQPAKPGQGAASEEFSTGRSDDYEPAEIRWARLHHEEAKGGNASSDVARQSRAPAALPPNQTSGGGESTHNNHRNASGDHSRTRARNHSTDQEIKEEAHSPHKTGTDSASIEQSQHDDKAEVLAGHAGGDDDEEDEVNSSSADGTPNETLNWTHRNGLNVTTTGTTLNRTLNTTRNMTSTATRNMTHNGTLNVTRNGTSNASHNATTGQPHQHLACKGGPLAACQCLFACKVFGARPSQCSGSKVALLDVLVKRALSSPADACRGMQCIVRCSKSLGCFDKKVEKDCRQLANQSAHLSSRSNSSSNQTQHLRRLRTTKEDTCRYECEEEEEEEEVAAARRALTT